MIRLIEEFRPTSPDSEEGEIVYRGTTYRSNGEEVEFYLPKELQEQIVALVANAKTKAETAREEVFEAFLVDAEAAKKRFSSNIPEWGIGIAYVPNNLVRKGAEIYTVTRPHTSTNAWIPGEPSGKDLYTKIGDIDMEEGEYLDWVAGSYPIGSKVWYNGQLYECKQGDASGMNHWEPEEYGWEPLGIFKEQEEQPIEEPEPEEQPETQPEPADEPATRYPAWKPWDGDNSSLYQIGAKVSHNGKNWEATLGNNHWEPGVGGWEEIT